MLRKLSALVVLVGVLAISIPAQAAVSKSSFETDESPVAEAMMKPIAVASSISSTLVFVPLAAFTGIFNYRAVPGLADALVVRPWKYVVHGE